MAKWLKHTLYFSFLLLMMVPLSASAQSEGCPPTCYASQDGTTTDLNDLDAGSYTKQWKATTWPEMGAYLEEASRRIAKSGQQGIFYWAMDSNKYWKYTINSQGEVSTGIRAGGQVPPPVTGVPLPFPMLLIGMAVLGAILLVAGYLLRPRLSHPARSVR